MRILSQDGMIDVNYDLGNLSIASGRYEDVERAGIYFYSCSCPNATRLAEYTSVEKARKAMEMLHAKYSTLRMQEVIDRNVNQAVYERIKNEDREKFFTALFQFPSDDEVEA